jgi:hypothetical protein
VSRRRYVDDPAPQYVSYYHTLRAQLWPRRHAQQKIFMTIAHSRQRIRHASQVVAGLRVTSFDHRRCASWSCHDHRLQLPHRQLDKENKVELEAIVFGLCDRVVITGGVKAQGGSFLARVFEEMRKNRAKLTTALGEWHSFLVDGKAVYVKLRKHPVPMKNSDPIVETVGTLVLGETLH